MFKNYLAIILVLLTLPLVFFLSSCAKFDKEEPIPCYISIPSIQLVVPDSLKGTQGTASAKISDAWVYIDDKFQGTYELPAKFPVLKEGAHTIKIKAGIKENGIGSTRPAYPFYTEYYQDVFLNQDSFTVMHPIVYYRSYTSFVWKENFEGVATTVKITDNSDTSFKLINNPLNVFEGQKSLYGAMDNNRPILEFKTSNAYELNTSGVPVFLELNYKCNSPIFIGFIANSSLLNYTQPVITLNPTVEGTEMYWNKIYINLSDFLGDYYQASNFNIVFRCEKSENIGLSEIYLDNIKLLQ